MGTAKAKVTKPVSVKGTDTASESARSCAEGCDVILSDLVPVLDRGTARSMRAVTLTVSETGIVTVAEHQEWERQR